MAAVAGLRQPDERFGETVAALGVDRAAKVRKGRPALRLDELGEGNVLEHGIMASRRVEVLLDESQFVAGKRPVHHLPGIGELEVPQLGRAHDVGKRRHGRIGHRCRLRLLGVQRYDDREHSRRRNPEREEEMLCRQHCEDRSQCPSRNT
jgi:hypothetical protein